MALDPGAIAIASFRITAALSQHLIDRGLMKVSDFDDLFVKAAELERSHPGGNTEDVIAALRAMNTVTAGRIP